MSFFEAFASGRIQFFFCYCETGRVATWSESNWCVISSESGDKSKKFFTTNQSNITKEIYCYLLLCYNTFEPTSRLDFI